MKKCSRMLLCMLILVNAADAQNVGIGTNTPAHQLTVVASGDGIVTKNGTVEIGTWVNSSSAYLQTYSSTPLYLSTANGSPQVSLLVNGNLGIGNSTPAYKLDVNGTQHTTGDITAGSDVNVTGDVTVQNGKGIIRGVNSTQLKYYSRDAGFAVSGLAAFGFIDAVVNFTNGIFVSAPRVIIGDVLASPAPTGEFYKVRIVVFGTDNNSCNVRIYNDSNAAVTFNATWSVICIGN